MATIDEINLLDYQAPTPEQILKAGRKPVAEPIPLEEQDPFYYKILNPSGRKLVDMVRAEINNPLNYLTGAGVISKGKGIASVISDDVAKRIFSLNEELDALKTLNKRQDRVKERLSSIYNEPTAKQTKVFEAEEKALKNQIDKLESKILDKVEKRFDFALQKRTISGLDPAKVDRLGKEDISKISKATSGQKNKAIIEQLGKYLDSPSVDYFGTRYGTEKFSEKLGRRGIASLIGRDLTGIKTKVDPSGQIQELNPLEAFESGGFTSQTFQIGDDVTPLFVDPKKLANKLDKSGSGQDFFKLRKDDEGYLDMLEKLIKKRGYEPSPIEIVVQPSGNTVISEGNHRLFRALSKGDKEVPIRIRYEGGAERLNVPFGIRDLDSLLADGQTGIKNAKQFQKYIDDVNKTYKPALKGSKIADDKVGQGISNRIQKIKKLTRELELEGGDMLPKTVKRIERKIVKLMEEIDEMSK